MPPLVRFESSRDGIGVNSFRIALLPTAHTQSDGFRRSRELWITAKTSAFCASGSIK
jgi:hypothetical protein